MGVLPFSASLFICRLTFSDWRVKEGLGKPEKLEKPEILEKLLYVHYCCEGVEEFFCCFYAALSIVAFEVASRVCFTALS